MTITMGPTMVNPDALHSEDELRAELRLANERLISAALRIARQDAIGNLIVGAINEILMLHVSHDMPGLSAYLDQYLEQRPRMREKLEEWREVPQMKKPH